MASATSNEMNITFYGVRGSLPSPARGNEVQAQIARALVAASKAGARFDNEAEANAWLNTHLPFHERAHYGGETTCIAARCGEALFIVDAGTGIRRLGMELMPELARNGKLEANILFTHMHMDHIVGFPFFAPLFAPKRKFQVKLMLHGGTCWQSDLETVLSATLSAPLFPVSIEKLRAEAASVISGNIYDGMEMDIDGVHLLCRRLHHPNETYGWRIDFGGKVLVVATDTEPYAGPDNVLSELAAGADVLYVDSQYDWNQYTGKYDGFSRVGWGHGYAEWCGRYARDAGVRLAVTGHHDPAASNQRISDVGEKMRQEFPHTIVGFDGMRVRVTDDEVIALEAGPQATDYRVSRQPG